MIELEQGKLLRVFVGELDKVDGQPLYEAILRLAQSEGLAGGTVLRGVESFGGSGEVHSAKVLRLSERLPLVVEIVDRAEKLDPFLSALDKLLVRADCGGLVTMEKVSMRQYPG